MSPDSDRLMALDLPLFRRELLQRAQQRRTYVMRCLVLLMLSFIFMIPFAALYYQNARVAFGAMGYGRQLVQVIFMTLGTMLYVLGPAMCSGAISTEKTKQTLPLLLVSRLSALNIIVEKLASQLVPMLVFLVLSVPLLAVSYLFGGISFAEVAGCFGLLCLLAAHIVSISLFWSALLPTALAAFWATYGTLFVTSFGLSIASGLADEFSPVLGHLIDLGMTPLAWFVWDFADPEMILFPMYHASMLGASALTVPQAYIAAIPFNVISILFLVAARMALVKYGEGNQFSFRKTLRSGLAWLRPARNRSAVNTDTVRTNETTRNQQGRASRLVPRTCAIAWRERQRIQKFGRWYLVGGIFLLFWYFISGTGSARWAPVSSAFFTVCFLIFALMVVLSLSSRLFVTERERQTLDSLLTCPLVSREILRQKLAAVHTVMLCLLLTCAAMALIRIFNVRFNRSASIFGPSFIRDYWSSEMVPVPSIEWVGKSFQYVLSFLGHAVIYMQIVKWIAVWFGLKTHSQMRAMLGSLLTVLLICFGPLILLTLFLVAADLDPDSFPLFFFVSPMFVFGFGELDELHAFYRNSWLPASDMFCILANFAVYGTLAVGIRHFVLGNLNELLSRRDTR